MSQPRLPQRLIVASANRHKVDELSAMLNQAVGPGWTVLGLKDLAEQYGRAPDIEESAPDFMGNATLKAEGVARWLRAKGEAAKTRVLADDSGVCVAALGGAPGVHSARFCGHHGSDADNNATLVAKLRAAGVIESPAHYACVLALCRVDDRALPGGKSRERFVGRWDVVAKVAARGDGGFGYDPHCWLQGKDGTEDRTVAELAADEKAALSHRGKAFAAMVAWWRGR